MAFLTSAHVVRLKGVKYSSQTSPCTDEDLIIEDLFFNSLKNGCVHGHPCVVYYSSSAEADILIRSVIDRIIIQKRTLVEKPSISLWLSELSDLMWDSIFSAVEHETENWEHPSDFIPNRLFSSRGCCQWQISQSSVMTESISFSSWIDLKTRGARWWSDGVSMFIAGGFTPFQFKSDSIKTRL